LISEDGSIGIVHVNSLSVLLEHRKFTPDNDFDYYTLNLKTAGLTPGTYLLYLTINGDPVRHSLTFIIG